MPSPEDNQARAGHRLIQAGILLFLLGLLTGFVGPTLANPRMGLSSHLEGVMNGLFLVAIGLLWTRLSLPGGMLSAAFWLALYGTFANWAATMLAAAWGAGGAMMPIAAPGRQGTSLQEGIVTFLLYSLSLAMVALCVILLWGLAAGARKSGVDQSRQP